MITELKPYARLRFYGKSARTVPGIREYLAARVPFVAGNMTGVTGAVLNMGQAPSEVRSDYARHAPYIVYTVLSYRTPIAWVTSDGAVTVPDVKYSPTTTGHQGTLWGLNIDA